MDYLERRLKAIRSEIATAANDAERLQQLMSDFKDASELRNSLARRLGSNIIL
jgi:DNA primase